MGASITQERAGNASMASVASGKRLAKSKQLQVISRTRRHYCGDAKAVVLDFTNSKMRGSPAFAADRCIRRLLVGKFPGTKTKRIHSRLIFLRNFCFCADTPSAKFAANAGRVAQSLARSGFDLTATQPDAAPVSCPRRGTTATHRGSQVAITSSERHRSAVRSGEMRTFSPFAPQSSA